MGSTALLNNEKFYLTTAIAYLNGPPHVGHAYEFATADVIYRYHEAAGRDTYFVTGSDEHGQKVNNTAAKHNVTPQEWCDKTVASFHALNAKLNLGQHTYIRTTDQNHIEFAQWLWRRVRERGDLYLGSYKGWYNVKEETFITDRDAEATGYKCPETGIPYEQRDEETWFFKMSKFHNQIYHLIKDTDFVQPVTRRNELIQRMEKAPLEDLCVSRVSMKWGIPVPDDDNHVMYVWFDALSNYLSAIRYNEPDSPTKKYWPADCHLIGKDITWFHCVIWPAILMSAELPMPKCVYAHGFVQDASGAKMSKTLQNTVSPMETLNIVSTDSFRYYLVKEGHYGQDIRFNGQSLIDMHNAELCATLGNLVHRIVALTVKFSEGKIPEEEPMDHLVDCHSLFETAERHMANYALEELANLAINVCREGNKYLTDKAPWAMKDMTQKRQVIRSVLEAVYVCAHFLYPIIPAGAATILERLNAPMKKLSQLEKHMNLVSGVEVKPGAVLYTQLAPDALNA